MDGLHVEIELVVGISFIEDIDIDKLCSMHYFTHSAQYSFT